MKKLWQGQILSSVVAMAGSLLIGYVDEHATEEVVTLGLVLALNFVLADIAPLAVWKFPLLVALGVCFIKRVAAVASGAPADPHFPQTLTSYGLLALVLSVAGVIGVAGAMLLNKWRSEQFTV